MFGQLLATRLAIPLLEGLVGDLSFDEKLCELPPLCLALERHEPSCQVVCVETAEKAQSYPFYALRAGPSNDRCDALSTMGHFSDSK